MVIITRNLWGKQSSPLTDSGYPRTQVNGCLETMDNTDVTVPIYTKRGETLVSSLKGDTLWLLFVISKPPASLLLYIGVLNK